MKKKYRTRFPMARIKKIMQLDEEVGKIAQATPILISKSLELFMKDLIENTSEITSEKNSQTISAAHLKQCIKTTERFDFLTDIVERAPDVEPEKEPKRGRPRKSLSASDPTSTPPMRGTARRGKRGRPPGVRSTRTPKTEAKEIVEHPPPPIHSPTERLSGVTSLAHSLPPVSSFKISPILDNSLAKTELATVGESPAFNHFPAAVQSSAGLAPVNLFNSNTISLPSMPGIKEEANENKGEVIADDSDDYDDYDD